jgi:hypothetical protein
MTDKEVMQQALDALLYHTEQTRPITRTAAAIAALRERLEQPEQEPVAWISQGNDVSRSKNLLIRLDVVKYFEETGFDGLMPLYAAPQPRQWQGLTDEEVGALTVFDGLHHVEVPVLADFIRAIEAKIKEKNK